MTIVLVVAVSFPIKRAIVRSLRQSCRDARAAEDWERLQGLGQRWRWWDRDNVTATLYLAEAACGSGQYEWSVELLSGLPDGDPITPSALLECSSILFERLNRPIEGAEKLERAVKLNPRLVEGWHRLIFFYAFTLQRQKMAAHARAAIACDADMPETYAYLMLEDSLSFGNAYDENTKWSRANPNEELFLVARAIHRIRAKGLDETSDLKDVGPFDDEGRPLHAKVIADYSQRFPRNLELLAYRLERSIAKGDVEAAAEPLADLPAEAEADNRFWRYRGWLRMARGELAEAEACYRKALELNCYDHLSRHQLASVLRQSKRMAEVKALEDVAVEGKNLRKALFHAPAVNKVPKDVLGRMAQYARHCGDTLVADKLESRLREKGGPAPNGTTTGQTAKNRGS